jgi:outer membrane receptor for ferrienterochelin and colicin
VLSATYFHKETNNQVDVKTFIPTNARIAGDYGFAEFVNNSFAKAGGIELTMMKEQGSPLTGSISYTFMSTEGVSENARGGLQYYQWGVDVPAKPFPLSWDQQHTVKVIGSLELPFTSSLSVSWIFHSGRPYTYFPSKNGFTPDDPTLEFEPNNARLESFSLVNIEVKKHLSVESESGTPFVADLYVDVRNLFNTRNVRWVDSSGKIGGELGDVTAWEPARRVRIGVRIDL